MYAARLLRARKLVDSIEPKKSRLAKQYFADMAIQEAAFILQRIDKKRPYVFTGLYSLHLQPG